MHFNNDTDLYRTIGSNIKHYRQQANLTQMQLAEKAQISISYLCVIFCFWRSSLIRFPTILLQHALSYFMLFTKLLHPSIIFLLLNNKVNYSVILIHLVNPVAVYKEFTVMCYHNNNLILI